MKAKDGADADQADAGAGGKRSKIEGLDPSSDVEQFEEIIAENMRLVNENPQQAALLIRYWLNDGKI